jgi:hypothetical protein
MSGGMSPMFGENSALLGSMQGSAGNSAGVGYTNPRDSVGSPYTPSYTPQTATPFLQSIMAQQSSSPFQQSNNFGLPSLQSMFNMPQTGNPYQTSGLQQLAPMAPYAGSAYRPDISGVMSRLNSAAPAVTPDQVSRLDMYGKPIGQSGLFGAIGGGD